MMLPAPEPKRILQLFSWDSQEPWQNVPAAARLEWLDFVIKAAWAGAALQQSSRIDPPPRTAGDDARSA